jgi:tripartite-type tricarboxylate transporter receptor subunit TctC
MQTRRGFLAFLTAFGASSIARHVWANDYPSRAVTIVVPYAAGGAADTLARIVADRMRVSLGHPVMIENVTGASGSIGVGRVARAVPDGYTLAEGNWSTHVANGAIYPLPYDLLSDFEPIALMASTPLVIAARKNMPANSLKELIAWLKANPDKASQGTNGPGSIVHLAGVSFQRETDTHFQFVPYRGGGAAAMQDLLGGQIDLYIGLAPLMLPHVRSGNIKAYAVTSRSRLEVALDIPTVDEAGLPGLYASAWLGLWAPNRTPQEIVAKLNVAAVDALADPTVRVRLTELGLEVPPREQQTPKALGAFQQAEIDKWWPIIKAAGIKPE